MAAVPTVPDYNVTTDENTPISGTVVGTDADNDPLAYDFGTAPSNGTLSVNSLGEWQYTPNPGFSGEDSFTVTVNDNVDGQVSSTITVTVTPYAPTLDDVKAKISGAEPLNYKDFLCIYTEAKAKLDIVVEDVVYYNGKMEVDLSADDLSTASGVLRAVEDINKLVAHGTKLASDLASVNVTTAQQTKMQELVISLDL